MPIVLVDGRVGGREGSATLPGFAVTGFVVTGFEGFGTGRLLVPGSRALDGRSPVLGRAGEVTLLTPPIGSVFLGVGTTVRDGRTVGAVFCIFGLGRRVEFHSDEGLRIEVDGLLAMGDFWKLGDF